MHAKMINPFLNASMNLFKEHLDINITAGRPFLNKDAQNLFEVSAIIGLAGDIQGAVVLSFKRETAIGIVSKLVGKQFNALTNEIIDGVGEMANIIAGNAKKDLSEARIEISLPGVITGTGQQINWPSGIPVITIPFQSPMGDFTVNISLKD
jgi:chemotaxis protein CheX